MFAWYQKICIILKFAEMNCEIRQITGRARYNRRRRRATLMFSVKDDTAATECSLDGGVFESCKSARTHAYIHV